MIRCQVVLVAGWKFEQATWHWGYCLGIDHIYKKLYLVKALRYFLIVLQFLYYVETFCTFLRLITKTILTTHELQYCTTHLFLFIVLYSCMSRKCMRSKTISICVIVMNYWNVVPTYKCPYPNQTLSIIFGEGQTPVWAIIHLCLFYRNFHLKSQLISHHISWVTYKSP